MYTVGAIIITLSGLIILKDEEDLKFKIKILVMSHVFYALLMFPFMKP